MKTEWMPENPHSNYKEVGKKYGWQEEHHAKSEYMAYQEGGGAYLKAVIGWLEQPCTEHDYYGDDAPKYVDEVHNCWKYKHRKDCPQCWQEFKNAFTK